MTAVDFDQTIRARGRRYPPDPDAACGNLDQVVLIRTRTVASRPPEGVVGKDTAAATMGLIHYGDR